MNDEDVELTIEIKFENKTIVKKSTKEIKLEDLIKQCISEFKIDKQVQKKLFFTDGNNQRIEKTDDLIRYSKEIEMDEKYLLNINLKIEPDTNNNTNEDNYIESVEYDKDSEEILNEKDKKIKELEEIIEKMKKEQSEELNKPTSDNVLTDSETVTAGHGQTSSLDKNEKDEIEKIIAELFQKEKKKFLSDIKKIKNDIITDIKNELNKGKTNDDEFEKVKKNIEELNGNFKKINDIQEDLSTIKEKIENIERKECINDDENIYKDTNLENNKENYEKNETFNNNNKLYNMPTMDKIRIYKCLNCNNSYVSNECINKEDNKSFEEHNFQIEDLEKYINDNNEKENNKNENNKNENDYKIKNDDNNIKIMDNYIEVDKKENKIIEEKNDNQIKNMNDIIIDEDEDNKKNNENKKEEIIDEKDKDIKLFNNKLEDFFFYEDTGNIRKKNPHDNELNKIEEFYNYLIDKNIEIKEIKDYLENFIQYAVRPEMETINYNEKKQVNNRIYRIRNVVNSLKPKTNQNKNKNNNYIDHFQFKKKNFNKRHGWQK